MVELSIRTDDLVTCNQAAKMLGVSRPTVYNMIERYQLHSVVIGRNRYLLRSEVERVKPARGGPKNKRKGTALFLKGGLAHSPVT